MIEVVVMGVGDAFSSSQKRDEEELVGVWESFRLGLKPAGS